MVKRICVITGTRAEYGLLKPLIMKMIDDKEIDLKLVVTGMHMSTEFGLTYKLIEEDGIVIDEKIEILLSSDSHVATSKAMGLAIISFSEYINRTKPDMVIVLGDRYEILAASISAMVANVPIAHIHGGEITEGAQDDVFRHCITKLSYLHFTSTESYRKRVMQLGEEPNRVFNVGAIGIENIKELKLLSKEEIEKSINFTLNKKFALVTFHPVTLEQGLAKIQITELLGALEEFDDMKFIITKANSDNEGRKINRKIDEFISKNPEKYIGFVSMGQLKYLSAMKYCSMVIGNSSSGIIEAPSFNIPTINIGDRQKGRLQAKTVINCDPIKSDIIKAIKRGLSKEFKDKISKIENPYGDGDTSNKILYEIKKALSKEIELKKTFYDINMM
ncbi:UDP-N-acetylglucosamine 2-epimerase [uncultured Clostridium sp.]|uniref:UDP-N-acetylglucosamine 2-epimerase n=1 Tax=uncultured Clostridium sp. TaxID=59620 RepID=UPI00321740E7